MINARLHIKSELGQLPMLYAFCEEHGIRDQALLALEEAIVNIANYSGANYIDLTYQSNDRTDTFIIEDDGIMFDPTAYEPSDDNAEELIVGGQGIRIIRSMMDTMLYHRDHNKNILTLVKTKQ